MATLKEKGTAEDSFVTNVIRDGLQPEEEEDFAYVAGTMFVAGSDTVCTMYITRYSNSLSFESRPLLASACYS